MEKILFFFSADGLYTSSYVIIQLKSHIRGTFFYVRREVDLIKTAKVNAYIMHIFGKIELLSIYATKNYFKMHYFNVI